MNFLQMHSTLTQQQHKENKMSENTNPAPQAEATLSPVDADTLKRFQAQEAKDRNEARAKAQDDAILAEPNKELIACVGECEVARTSPDYDKVKADVSNNLFRINETFEADVTKINNDMSVTKEERTARRDDVIDRAEAQFDRVVDDTIDIMETRYKQADKALFSNNITLSHIDGSIIQNKEFVDKLLKTPYDMMNIEHGEANGNVIVHLAKRGFLSDTFTKGNFNIYDGANQRFTPESYNQMKVIEQNKKSLDMILSKQKEKFRKLKSKKPSTIEALMGKK